MITNLKEIQELGEIQEYARNYYIFLSLFKFSRIVF